MKQLSKTETTLEALYTLDPNLAVIEAAVRKHGSNPYGALVDNDLLRSEAYLQDGI